MLLSVTVGIRPFKPRPVLSAARTPVSQCSGFHRRTNALSQIHFWNTCPPCFEFSLSQLGEKNHPNQEAKDNFQTSEVDTKRNYYFLLHFLKSLFWEILLIFFISLPPFLFNFQSALSDNSAWLLSNRPVHFLLVQAYNTKEYKEDWKCNYKTVSSAQAQFFQTATSLSAQLEGKIT